MAAALSLVVQHVGLGSCPGCPTREQRLCPDPWFHMATAMCPACESTLDFCAEHAEECPTVAITRLSTTCRATASMRDHADVQAHVRTHTARKEQFTSHMFEPVEWEYEEGFEYGDRAAAQGAGDWE